MYSADLQAGIRTAANKTNVDYTSLNDSMSNMVSQLSAARIRLKQSSGPYEEMDPEGNVVFNTQTDKAYIKSATDFIKNAETNFGSVAYIQEEFKKIPMGNGEGETSRKFTSPYLGLLNAASNPASGQDVSVSYDMEYDNQTGHKMGIVLKGESVRRLNAQMGNEGDTYTIKPEEISNLMMGNNDPDNFGLFYQNPSTVSELEKKAVTNGILDEKDGSVTSDYMIEVDDAFEIVNELTGTKQLATVSQPNYPVIKQNMSGAVKSKLMTTLGKGMVSTSVLINTYAEQDEDGNYFYLPPKIENGNIVYTSDGKVDFGTDEEKEARRVYLGDGELEFDMSSDNESFGGLSKDDYEAVYGLIENEFMKRAGVYDPQVKKPYGDKMTVERKAARTATGKPTESALRRQRITGTIDDFIRNVELAKKDNAFNPETLDKARLDNVAELISGVYGGGKAEYDTKNKLFIVDKPVVYDENGNVITKGEKISIEYDPSDPNALDRLRQKLETSLGTTTEETQKGVTIGKSSPEETERDKRNRFESNFPNLRVGDGPEDNMEEEEELVEKLEEKFPTLKYNIPYTIGESITINGVEVSKDKGNYNQESIMDIVYEQLNKTGTEEVGTEVQTTGNSMSTY